MNCWQRLLSVVVFFVALDAAGNSEQVSTSISLDISGFSVSSHGTVTYFPPDCLGCGSGYITGSHVLNDGSAGTIARAQFGPNEPGSQSYLTSYSGDVSAGTEYEHCYRAAIDARGEYGTIQGSGSEMKCAPAAPPPPPPAPWVCNPECANCPDCMSPVVISLRGPYQLTGPEDPVDFDINATGTRISITWTARGAPMAFLALDRNIDGVINDGAELFGNHTPLPCGVRAANGFEALAQYDSNNDGILDATDPIWSSLVLWTDINHDAVSQPSEIEPLSASTVAAIGLDYRWTGRRDAWGNMFRYESRVWISRQDSTVPRPVYDVFFRSAR